MQWSRSPSVACVAVDVQRVQQLHQPLLVAQPSRFQQLVLAVLSRQNRLRIGVGQVQRRFVLRVPQLRIGTDFQQREADVDLAFAD